VFDLPKPDHRGGWTLDGEFAVAHVEQGHYGHMARKATWLLAAAPVRLQNLVWGPALQRLPEIGLARHGYEKARRSGVMAYVGGKEKDRIRAATPAPFRDLLISMVLPQLGDRAGASAPNSAAPTSRASRASAFPSPSVPTKNRG
jgi:hypothetical protein